MVNGESSERRHSRWPREARSRTIHQSLVTVHFLYHSTLTPRPSTVFPGAAMKKPVRPRNAFYAQSGGVTAVINASACGVIETARKHKDRIGKVYAGRNGIIGALTEDMI